MLIIAHFTINEAAEAKQSSMSRLLDSISLAGKWSVFVGWQ